MPWKNLKKEKIYFIIYAPKMDKNHRQGLKNLRKNIFNVLEANLDENLIFEKKSQSIHPNTKIFDIFEILKLV